MRAIVLILLVVAYLGVAASAVAQGTIDFTSTSVPGVTADALAVDLNGSLWYVNGVVNTVNSVLFPDLDVSTFSVPTPSAGLSGITVGPDGNMWFTESAVNKIGRIDSHGTIAEFATPAGSPSPQRIFPGPNGTLWATACPFPGNGCSAFIVQNTAGLSSLLLIQTPSPLLYSADRCTLGADGNVWCLGNEDSFNPFHSQFKIARIDSTGGYTAFAPATGVQGSAIVAAPDGNVWYTWLSAGSSTGVARVKPSGAITEYPVPTGKPQSWIFGLAVGADGNLYFPDRKTSVLYELVLSTATDAGTATINSGHISIDIPEDIVAVSGGTAQSHCPAVAFIVRSAGSGFGGIAWIQTAGPSTCTDMVANGEALRGDEGGTPLAFASCSVKPAPASPDIALNPTLTIEGLGDAVVGNAITKVGWQMCEVLQNMLQCSAPGTFMTQGQTFSVTFVINGFESGLARVTCASSTPELTTYDNEDTFLAFIGLTDLYKGRSLVNINIRSVHGPR